MIKAFRERVQFALYCVQHRRSLAAQRRWQLAHLRRLLKHAYAHVPLWRQLLDEKNLTPDSVHTLADISKLPITSKQTFLGRTTEECIDSSRLVNTYWYVTSGTSGMPLRFLVREIDVVEKYVDFGSFRFLWWLGVPVSHFSSIKLARIKIRAPSNESRFFIPVEEYLRDPRQAIAQITHFGPEVISTYPSILLDMAHVLSKDKSLPRLSARYVLSFGEMLTPSLHRYLTDTLGCEIYDRYGLEEIGAIGVDCKEHDGYHINTESVIIEITDDSSIPVEAGVEGRIFATDLFNYGMPFIRYDTGDRGMISNEPCPCGLKSPRLWLKGRYSAYLTFPARRIHHLEFDGAMDGFMNYIFMYQIAKKSDTEILARIIPGPAFHPGVPEEIRKSLQSLVGSGVAVGVETTDVLPITPRGKSRIVIDESQ